MLKRHSEDGQPADNVVRLNSTSPAKDFPLSRHEWQAILAAFLDTSAHSCGDLPTSRSKGFLATINRVFRNLNGRPDLADPKIEKLRTFVCFARQHGHPSPLISSDLVELGYTDAQVHALTRLALQEFDNIQ